jgi:outer membrane protein assembly factor BamB
LEGDTLYLCDDSLRSGQCTVSAINVKNKEEKWKTTIPASYIYKMSVIDDLLLLSTRDGLVAVDKHTGNVIWQTASNDIFYTVPVGFHNVIYIKGSSRKVYAILPNDGKIIGYIQMEVNRPFRPKHETLAGVYSLEDGIVFNTRASIYIFKIR